jgi:DHA3 family macrolide efflux protein-like MFS transporter
MRWLVDGDAWRISTISFTVIAMRRILRHRPLRLIFLANLVSMLGSGMNSAAVFWHVLQMTHSELALGKLLVLQTLPALLLLPFSGVVIDREDRRHIVLLLDFARGSVILCVAILALRGKVQLWHLYAMNTLVAAGFWLFWPTINALIQELTPEFEFVQSNTMLLAGVQGGWLLAGAVVGFLYNHIGLGWILIIDCATYVISFLCYFIVRRGRSVVARPQRSVEEQSMNAWHKFWQELHDGFLYLRGRTHLVMLGTSWALFLGAMLTQGAVTAPLSDRILRSGAVGYGWLNGGWGTGAFLSAAYASQFIKKWRARFAAGLALAVLSVCLFALPFSRYLWVAVALYTIMGSGRGLGGTALSSEMMEIIPKHFMGRVQNTFYFAGTMLQLVLSIGVAAVANNHGLTPAFAIIGVVYLIACLASIWPVNDTKLSMEEPAAESLAH